MYYYIKRNFVCLVSQYIEFSEDILLRFMQEMKYKNEIVMNE